MKRLMLRLAVLVVLASLPGCRGIVNYESTVVSGSVLYPNGEPVVRALVTAASGESTFADDRGVYRLTLPRYDSTYGRPMVTLDARDGYDPRRAFAVTHFGQARAVLDGRHVVQDIVLTESSPI